MIIKDKRVLKGICKEILKNTGYEILINKDFNYIKDVFKDNIQNYDNISLIIDIKKVMYKNKKVEIKYFSGCFNPYICLV